MHVMTISVQNIQKIQVCATPILCAPFHLLTYVTGVKEVVTLTSDLSRKNLEKDFERMDTPQGTFYRVYFDIYLTLDGSEFNAELVCQGEVMGRCSSRFR